MSKKVLTETELKKLLREVVAMDELHKAGLLTNEGAWDWVKHKLSKLGSLEKGGKFDPLGRRKHTKEAEAELQAILDKASNKTIRALHSGIQEKYPEFPNQKDQQQYAQALTDVYVFYDSLVQAAKKKPGEKGHFPCAAANELIADLKKVVKKWTDYDLADVYKHLTEEQKRLLAEAGGDDEVLEELFDTSSIDERFMGGSKKWAKIAAAEEVDDQGRIVKPGGAAPGAPPAAAGGQEKTSRLGGGELATIEGLKSNLLPAALGLTGAAALIAGYIASQPAFINWLAGKLGAVEGLNPKTLTTEIAPAIDKTIGPLNGEGFTQMFGRMKGVQAAGGTFTSDTPVSALFEEFGKYGINPKNPTALFELGVDKASYMERLASGATSIGEMFPAGDKGLWLDLGKKTSVTVAKAIAKKVVTGTGTAAAASAAAVGTAAMAGPLLAGLGIALIASGAAVKLIRMKGLESSRAKSLKTLFDALKPVDCEDTPPPPPPPPGQCTDEEEAQGKTWRDDLDPPACDCPEGMVFSEKAGKCIKDEDVVENCGYMGLKDGTNPETGEPGCVCPDTGKFVPTEHWDDWQETGWCKDDDEEGKCSDEETAQGKEWNEADQVCACPEGLVEDPETGKCVKQPALPPKTERPTKPGIAVLDDDDVSIFRIRWRNPDKIDAQKDVYKAAEDAVIIGTNTDPKSDQVAKPSFEYRPFKANAKTFAQIKKKALGKSGVEPHFAIDGSIISDLANKSGKSRGAKLRRAGLGKDIAIRLTKEAFKAMLRDERKLAGEEAEKIMAQLGVDDEGKRALALAQMQAYGLVQPERAKKRRRKARAAVQEAKQLDRWKVLSGIK